MKVRNSTTLTLAALLISAPLPIVAQQSGNMAPYGDTQTSNMQGSSGMEAYQNQDSPFPMRGQREAMRMVQARADFVSTIDSMNTPPGTQFRAKLTRTVHLENGPELPRGTMLVGKVVQDQNDQLNGKAKLALRFDTAYLKDGRQIPIKATIVGVFQAPGEANETETDYLSPGEVPVSWNDGTLAVDEIDALKNVDLHSRIASPYSGVFVSTKKDDIKLTPSHEVTLAIAMARNNQGNISENNNMQNGASQLTPEQSMNTPTR